MKYLGIVLLVLSGYVMAEEVYYCSDNHRGVSGFTKKDGQYQRQGFIEKKFKMKLQDDGNIVIDNPAMTSGKELYVCSTPYNGTLPKYKNMKSCSYAFNNGNYFDFNPGNGRYIWFSGFGYVWDNTDDVSTQIGTCTKF